MPRVPPIGLRIDPAAGAGYNAGLEYTGDRPTKFGVHEDDLPAALEAAARHRLTIDTIHFHAGSGWLGDGLPKFEAALAKAARITAGLLADGHPIAEVNVGGGLGKPARSDEPAIDLDAYTALLARHLGPLGVAVGCEPGDHIAKDAAIQLAEVVTVERKRGTTFVGLDMGWNVDCSYFIYRFLQEIVVCRAAGAPRTEIVTVTGHINEAGDVFAEDYPMPPVQEGDIVALLNGGGYLQAMSSTHCLRPLSEFLFLGLLAEAAPAAGGDDVDPDDWPVLEAVLGILRVLCPECLDGRRMLGGALARFQQRRSAVDP